MPKKNEKADDGLPTVRRCGTDEVHMRLLLEDPGYGERRAAIEDHAWRVARSPLQARTGCTRIPVVVHVVHRTAAENISQEQIDSQIEVLNTDFRRRNADVSSAPATFQSLAADARIEFVLADTDPDGNATDGVTRTRTTVNGFVKEDEAVKSAATGGADPWPADRYLNMWVCRLAGGLLGYAQFPGGPAATDGVVITHTGFGTTGTAAAPFDRGRTATHEIGHWLDVFHIFGNDLVPNCNDSDFVPDTPNQRGPNYGTPSFPSVSCDNGPNGDMFVNYMDYVDDAAMVLFTDGQVRRMHAALDGPRSSIGSATSCGPKLKFVDEPVTLKFRDDGDDLKVIVDDPIGTHKVLDDPGVKLKFRDDAGTVKVRDDPIKAIDDVKTPGLDKHPYGDVAGRPFENAVAGSGQPAPFVLATPHHSQAWQQSYPAAANATAAAYEQRLAQCEHALRSYAEAEAAGQLQEVERQALHQLYAEYTRLGQEYQQLIGGRR